MAARVLVVGATGNVGEPVVRELLRLGGPGVDVYAAARTAAASARLFGEASSPSGARLHHVALDVTQPGTFPGALAARPTAMLLVRPPAVGDPAACNALVDAAVAAGARHVVFLSVYGAGTNTMVPHHAIERHIAAVAAASAAATAAAAPAAGSSVPAPPAPGGSAGPAAADATPSTTAAAAAAGPVTYTFLRPSFFMSNLSGPNHVGAIRDKGVIDVPAGRGATSSVDPADVGAAAAAVLLRPADHANAAYSLTGSPEDVLTYDQVAAVLTAVTGRRITYGNPTTAGFAWRQRSAGVPWAFIGVMCAIYAVAWLGRAGETTGELAALLGRPPTSFRDWAAAHRGEFLPRAAPTAGAATGGGGGSGGAPAAAGAS
jgi:uncharacterized protein YbjT (DUF2867 family)